MANFNLLRNSPVFIIWFVIRVRGLMIDGATYFSKILDIGATVYSDTTLICLAVYDRF